MLVNKDREEEIRGPVCLHEKERRKESGNSWWIEKDKKKETRGMVVGKKRTGRKKLGEQLVERKGQEGINQEISWW